MGEKEKNNKGGKVNRKEENRWVEGAGRIVLEEKESSKSWRGGGGWGERV